MEGESRRSNKPGVKQGVMEEESWRGNHGGGIGEDESWSRGRGLGITEKDHEDASWRRHHGGGDPGIARSHPEGTRRRQGGTQEAAREQPMRHSSGTQTTEGSRGL